jgi:hypothetical protein
MKQLGSLYVIVLPTELPDTHLGNGNLVIGVLSRT